MSKNTVIVYTYRYIWKNKEGKLCVKFLTDIESAHVKFMESIRNDSSIVSCIREYVNEINFAYLGFSEEVKKENKEVKEDEKKG